MASESSRGPLVRRTGEIVVSAYDNKQQDDRPVRAALPPASSRTPARRKWTAFNSREHGGLHRRDGGRIWVSRVTSVRDKTHGLRRGHLAR